MRGQRTGVAGVALLLACGAAVLTPHVASASSRGVLVVDDDRLQCPGAAYTAIQQALDAAHDGDTVRVCGGTYTGDVTIDHENVSLVGKLAAATTVECLAAPTAYPAAVAVVRGSVTIAATGGQVDGLVIGGADTGLTTTDLASGYRVRRNIVEGNTAFGIQLASKGDRQTVVEKNCVRGNGTQGPRAGINSENGNLRNAVIRDNTTADNFEGISVAGPDSHSDVSIVRNTIRRESAGIAVSNTVDSDITGNDVDLSGAEGGVASGITIGGGNIGLTIASNTVTGAFPGVFITPFDDNSKTNVAAFIVGNTVRDNVGTGITAAPPQGDLPGNLVSSLFLRNVTTGNTAGSGISIGPGNGGNVLIANRSTNNLRGISLNGVIGTVVAGNTMRDNDLDARDLAQGQNTWIGNRCVTDEPVGTLCAVPVTRSTSPAAPAPTIPARPEVDGSRWPCLKVPYFEMDPDGTGAWSWITVVAPDAPTGTDCGA